MKVKVLVIQSCPTLCDPMDCSLLGSSVRGILQVRILEWIAMPSSGDLPNSGIETVSCGSFIADGILKDDAVKVLRSICQQIWKTQQWAQDWKRPVFIPIPKKGNAKE